MKVPKKQPEPGDAIEAFQAELGAKVRAHRLRMGITQEELAWRADMHRTYIADIECGGRNVTLRSVANLARALEVSVADLVAEACQGANGNGVEKPAKATGDILLVEDNAADIELTQHAFASVNLLNSVRIARDGQEAIDLLLGKGAFEKNGPLTPRLILLDLNLPKISGLEVLRQIRRHKPTVDVPVVIVTVSLRHEAIAECRRLGATQHIQKPLRFENLSHVVSKLNLHWALLTEEEARQVRAGRGHA
ncbi:MAG TPA: response regulator [Candidatus Didemnitutus sp.]|nr:response regulator [Candidatus Didemnitutus sp.]